MKAIVNRVVYDTEKATLLAHDRYWDGSNWERNGRNTFLYVGKNGRYFRHDATLWQGERDTIMPLTQEEAMDLYESLPEHEVEFTEAFPGVPLEEA
ncbi:hypothetical protein D6833_00330 [Candidatus Parcubacteria bacterium]|nr:MAG: hypothetical protein D6833_00330 [Candidatus Parcubacteria bacterium]